MTRSIQRIGDRNTGGGVILASPQDTVFVNSKIASVNGATGTPHGSRPRSHSGWRTAGGVGAVFINSIPVNVAGNTDSCGHQRMGGSSDVFIGET